MNFKNGKKRIGLIALLSCVLTATVAFAAYTGYNYINGTVEVVGNPFKMVFAKSDGTALEEGGTIDATTHATVFPEQNGPTASDITVGNFIEEGTAEPPGPHSSITDFKVTLKAVGNRVDYTFAIKNVGGSTAYLDSLTLAKTTMPTDAAGNPVTGLTYEVRLQGDNHTVEATSLNGVERTVAGWIDSGIQQLSVDPGKSVTVTVSVIADDAALFSAWTPEDSAADGAYGATFELGTVTIKWSAVPAWSTT